jgi:hypothetical protein
VIAHVVETPEADIDDLRAGRATIRWPDELPDTAEFAEFSQEDQAALAFPEQFTSDGGQVKESHSTVIDADPDEAVPEVREVPRSIPPFTCGPR